MTVLLDTHGIPHITAGSEADAAFAMGYMHGRDRRFQMELLRMDALGRLREFLGSRVPRAGSSPRDLQPGARVFEGS